MKTLCACISLFVVCLAVVGCTTSKDVTLTAGSRTDYVPNQIYRIQRAVFLFRHQKTDTEEVPRLVELGYSGTPSGPDEFRRRAPQDNQVVGLLLPGDEIKITKFAELHVPTLGNFFEVFAVILSGDNKGTIVQLEMISKERRPRDHAFVDPAYLVPVK
jgi:hypothetical protein